MSNNHRGVTFTLDDVQPATETLPEQPFCRRGLLVHSALPELVLGPPLHPLIHAVHLAFSDHRPLVLSPDVVWLTVAQGLAQHINLHAETLRMDMVRHQGQIDLQVALLHPPTTTEQWSALVASFGRHVQERHPELAALIRCDFSTTTPETLLASDVVLMDTLKQYYDYVVRCVCGIPSVTLLGNRDDWRTIRDRVEQLDRYGLSWWTERLKLACDHLVLAASGEPDKVHWSAIYKHRKRYGWNGINGWICWFFPYLAMDAHCPNDYRHRNRLLEAPWPPVTEVNDRTSGLPKSAPKEEWMSTRCLPTGLSTVPVRLEDSTGGRAFVSLCAGLMGVKQHWDLSLEPVAGWCVVELPEDESAIESALERLEAHLEEGDHVADGGQGACEPFRQLAECFHMSVPMELITFYERYNGVRLHGVEHAEDLRFIGAREVQFLKWIVEDEENNESIVYDDEYDDEYDEGRVYRGFLIAKLETGSQLMFGGSYWEKGVIHIDGAHAQLIARTLAEFITFVYDKGDACYFNAPGYTPICAFHVIKPPHPPSKDEWH